MAAAGVAGVEVVCCWVQVCFGTVAMANVISAGFTNLVPGG